MAVFSFGFLEQPETVPAPALKPVSLAEHRMRMRSLARSHWQSVGGYISGAMKREAANVEA